MAQLFLLPLIAAYCVLCPSLSSIGPPGRRSQKAAFIRLRSPTRLGLRFDELPDHVRHQGPWQGMRRGEIEKLKANYRRALARDGYMLVKCELAVFKPEA